jgi:ribonuclease HI
MIYYTDGFTIEGNPSSVGGGYTIVDEGGNLIETKVIKKEGFTNNEAELLGVLEGLKLCKPGDKIITDSMNTIYWIRSGNPKKRPDLKELCAEAKRLVEQKQVTVEHQPRALNLAGIYNEQRESERAATVAKPAGSVNMSEVSSLLRKLRDSIKDLPSEKLERALEHLENFESELR